MDDDVERGEELGLIKAFLSITDARKRQRVLKLAEQLAGENASDTTARAAAEASSVEGCRSIPDHRVE